MSVPDVPDAPVVVVTNADVVNEIRAYRRALKGVLAFWALSLLVLLFGLGYVLHRISSNKDDQVRTAAQANYDNNFNSALGNRKAIKVSCVSQNKHRALERRLLRRGLRSSEQLLKSGAIGPEQFAVIQRQNRQGIKELAARHCDKSMDLIPFPEPPKGVKARQPPGELR